MPSEARARRKERIGIVTSDKMDKTITVQVDRSYHHPQYGKMVRTATKFKAHDEKKTAKMGDTVLIQETRPISKTKRWRLVEVVKKANVVDVAENKAESNLARHGVSFVSAIAVLNDDFAITIEDIDHEEQRFITIGMDMECSILVLVYCYPDEITIRIISARKAEPHERNEYES